jgi:succinate dehydrogenase/fumarate reductase-like Fe-S protein
MALKNFKLFRGNSSENTMQDYSVKVDEGMVVLDAIHRIPTYCQVPCLISLDTVNSI